MKLFFINKREYECFLDCMVTYCAYMGVDYNYAFINSVNFDFTEKGNTLAERIKVKGLKSPRIQLTKCNDLKMNFYAGADKMSCLKNLHVGDIVFATTNTKVCPWFPKSLRNRLGHDILFIKSDEDSQYMPTIDVTKEENELIRLLEQPKLNFSVVAKCILQGAKVRFDCCEFDNGELTEELKNEISFVDKIDYKVMKEYIKQIIIQPDGRIITVFINNAHVVDPNDKPDEMVTRFKNEAVDNFEEYAEAYKEVFGANLYIILTDGQIDVGSGLEFAEKAIGKSEIKTRD